MDYKALFEFTLRMSLMGSITACVIFLGKAVLARRLGSSWQYTVWLLLVARLLIPFSLPSPLSIYNLVDPGSLSDRS